MSKENQKKLSNQLFEKFIINKRYYSDGKFGYRASRVSINEKTVEKMLEKKSSLLCYQEDYGDTKWICFDFDIIKNIVNDDNFQNNESQLYQELFIEIKKITKFLDSCEIQYLIEFSGNRGIHLWILFNNYIKRFDSYVILKTILNKSGLNLNMDTFALDKFPASLKSSSNTDKGKGVKCPLSVHPKSLNYTYFIDSFDNFHFDCISKNSDLTDSIIQNQLEIITNIKSYTKINLFEKLCITNETILEIEKEERGLEISNVKTTATALKDIIDNLSKCSILKKIFDKYIEEKELNDIEKKIVVGLLNRLNHKDGNHIGKDLLIEFFSKFNNYSEKITLERLENMNYFPTTCDKLKNIYNKNCHCDGILCPLEYLPDYEFCQEDIFKLDENLFNRIKLSELKYSYSNDEIFLHSTRNKIKFLDYEEINQEVNDIFDGSNTSWNYYEFLREEPTKNRTLHSLDSDAKVITTFFIKILDNFLHDKFSPRSYGYKFNPSFRKNFIFEPWLKQWNMYTKELKNIIFNDDFNDYYMLKLDISSFYDSISLTSLNISLRDEISNLFNNGLIDDIQKNKLNRIVHSLIGISRKINKGSSVGLPQGPAYARYLAEYFLVDLDYKLIDSLNMNDSFYVRYVDDIFIFVKTEKEQIDIFTKYKQLLEVKNLTHNNEKEFIDKVIEYRKKFNVYVNDTKYFIDQVDKSSNIETPNMIKKATSKLISIIEDGKTIDESNLSFLFTHLENNKVIDLQRVKLEDYILSTAKGRGSFYRNFFKYYLKKYSLNELILEKLSEIKALKRDVFLNELLEKIILSKTFNDYEIINELIDIYIFSDNNSYVGKLLLIQIKIYIEKPIGIEIIEKLFNSEKEKLHLFEEIITFNDLIKIPENLEIYIFDSLPSFKEKEVFDFLYKYSFLYKNNFRKTIIFFIEFLKKINLDSFQYISLKSQLQKYIQLLFLTTLYYKGDNFIDIIKPLFLNVLDKTNSFDDIQFITKLSKWVNKIKDEGFYDSNIQSLLSIVIDDNNLLSGSIGDRNRLLEYYNDELIKTLYLSSENQILSTDVIKDFKEKLIIDKKMIYLDWLGSSDYYPNEKICVKNAIENNIIVLKRENEILVRLKNDCKSKVEFDYFENTPCETIENIFNGEYKNVVYKFNHNNFDSIINDFESFKTSNELLQFLIDIDLSIQKFRERYFDNIKYISFSYNRLDFHTKTRYPLVPYLMFAKYFVEPEVIINNKENYYNSLLKLYLKYSEKSQELIKSNKFEFLEYFDKSEEKFDFLKTYLNLINTEKDDLTIFVDEKNLLLALINFLNIDNDKKAFYTLFKIYFDFNRQAQDYIIFNVIDIDLSFSNVQELYDLISLSFESNGFNDFELITDFLKEELKLISESLIIDDFGKFEKKELKINNLSDEFYIITLGEEKVDEDKILLLDLDFDQKLFKQVDKITLDQLEMKDYIFSFKDGDIYKIIKPNKVIYKIISVLNLREIIYSSNLSLELFNSDFKLKELMEMNHLNDAIKVLQSNHYKTSIYNDRKVAINHLYNWIKIFKNKEDRKSMLEIISKHIYLTNEYLDKFQLNITNIAKETSHKIFTTLKDPNDYNGTDRLLNLLNDNIFIPRQIKLSNFTQNILEEEIHEIVFIVDVIISGTQFCSAFRDYYLAKELDDTLRTDEYYHQIKNDFEKFKEKMKKLKIITIVSVLVTNDAKEKIKNMFRPLLPDTEILFEGEEKSLDVCSFKSLNHGLKEKFKIIINNNEFIDENFYFDKIELCRKYHEININDDNIDSMDIVTRINSMPKKSFCIFFAKTKSYNKSLFKYIEDK